MLKVPKSMLVDNFTYAEYDGVDRNHIPKYKDEKIIENVRIDRTRRYYRDSSESAVRAEATIFCYRIGTKPFIEFKEQSKVRFDNEVYTIKRVNMYKEVHSNGTAAIQLEVV